MAQNFQFYYNFINVTKIIIKGYLLDKRLTMRPKGKDTIDLGSQK
jgi:hypothetical protein